MLPRLRPGPGAPGGPARPRRRRTPIYHCPVFTPLTVALFAGLGAAGLYGAWLTVRGRQIDDPLLALLVLVEVLLVAQVVVGIARAGDADSGMSRGIFIAYLLGMVCVLPVAALWAIAERTSRWGIGVLLVAIAGLLVMTERLVQLWNGA